MRENRGDRHRSLQATIRVGSGPTAIAARDGAVWVANRYSLERDAHRRQARRGSAASASPASLTGDPARPRAAMVALGVLALIGLAAALRLPAKPPDPALEHG